MKIGNLKLSNFRNIIEGDIALSDDTTVFYGGVGEGKTNLIEAIYMLSLGRSFRTVDTNQVITWGKSETVVRGEGVNSTGSFSVAVKLGKGSKKVEINGDSNKRSIELIGGLKSVIFHSDDVGIISGAPHFRRKFLDLALSQGSKNYLFNLRDYHKILKQRNSALSRYTPARLDEWDEQLSVIGSWLTQVRANVIGEISLAADQYLKMLAGDAKKFEIRYIPSGEFDKELYRGKLFKSHDMDRARGATQVGPHRDDFRITLGGMDARHYTSSGEKKTIALALKLAEMEFLKSITGEKPIMLLDDLFSTLDIKRSRALLSAISDGKSQNIITVTDLNIMKDAFGGDALMYEVKEGSASRST